MVGREEPEKQLIERWKGFTQGLSVQFSSVAQPCPTLWDPMDCSTPGFPVHHQLSELTQTHVHWISDVIQPSHPLSSNHLIICCLLLFLPSIFPSIRVFSSKSVLHIRWTEYWSFSFSISPSDQWIFRTDFLQDGLVGSPCCPRDSQESSLFFFFLTTVQKHQFFSTQLSL